MRLKLGNGRFETAEFNSRQQLTQIGLGSTTTANDLWKVNYSYGELAANGVDVIDSKNTGNIAKQVITAPNATFTQTYRYDSLDRITEAKETAANGATTWQQSWNYDRFGNRLSFNSSGINLATINTTPAVNPQTNRFTSTQDFGYDKTGNVIKDKVNGNVRNFVFNGDNKQVHVKDANNNPIGTYYYDGNGARVKKSTASETTIFVYDAAGTLIAEYSTETPTATPTTSYTTTDHLGSPRVITDKNGNVTSRRDFMPFGEELNADATYRTPANKFGANDNIRQKFTGYLKDNETNLDFAEARYYNNQHGRFTAVDPLLASGKSGNPQSFNRFVYSGNNPIYYTDPSGLDWFRNGNTYRWSDDNKTFEDGTSFDGYSPVDFIGDSFSYEGCLDTSCSTTRTTVLFKEGGWDWKFGLQDLIRNAITDGKREMTWENAKKDFNFFMKDPLGERGLGNQGFQIFTGGMTSQTKIISSFKFQRTATLSEQVAVGANATEKVVVVVKATEQLVLGAKEGIKLLNPAINITEKGLRHTLDRHTINSIAKWVSKSKFFNKSEVEGLVKEATQIPMVKQANGNFARVVYATRNIGIDRVSGNPTNAYTVITNGLGNLVTAYPGLP